MLEIIKVNEPEKPAVVETIQVTEPEKPAVVEIIQVTEPEKPAVENKSVSIKQSSIKDFNPMRSSLNK